MQFVAWLQFDTGHRWLGRLIIIVGLMALQFGFYPTSASAQMVLIPLPREQLPPLPKCPVATVAQKMAAIKMAQKSSEKFFRSYDASYSLTRGDYQVLVRFDTNGESLGWVTVTGLIGDTFSSSLNQLIDPKSITNWKIGQKVVGRVSDILDWSYVRHGKIYGDFLVRADLSNCSVTDQKLWFNRGYQLDAIPSGW